MGNGLSEIIHIEFDFFDAVLRPRVIFCVCQAPSSNSIWLKFSTASLGVTVHQERRLAAFLLNILHEASMSFP